MNIFDLNAWIARLFPEPPKQTLPFYRFGDLTRHELYILRAGMQHIVQEQMKFGDTHSDDTLRSQYADTWRDSIGLLREIEATIAQDIADEGKERIE